jgi:hypothetical protein
MPMEDAMTDKFTPCTKPVVLARHLDDAHSLYVLIVSLLAALISLPAVWYFAAAAYASTGLIA